MTVQKNTTAIAEYSPTAAALADIATRMEKVVYDVSTPAGMEAARRDRAEVRGLRVALEHKRKEIKEPALKRCNEIDTEAKRITAELLKYETPPDNAIKAEEQRIENERLAKVAAEEKRQKDIQDRIAAIRSYVNLALRAKDSASVTKMLDELQYAVIDEATFGDAQAAAETAMDETMAELVRIQAEFEKREAEAAQLAADRAELDRQRAEQAERDRVAREAREAEEAAARAKLEAETKFENARLARERAAFEAEQAAAREKERQRQAVIDAENERIAAEQRAAQDKIDQANRELEARQKAERDAENAKIAIRLAEEQRQLEEAEANLRKNWRPTFDEIVTVVAKHFAKGEDTVRTWIAEPKAGRKAA